MYTWFVDFWQSPRSHGVFHAILPGSHYVRLPHRSLLASNITMERYLRSTVGELHRIVGFAFNSLSASSSSVQGLYCSSNSIENFHGTPQAIYSRSSSSSSTEDNTEGDENGWGHFADFRDELADEASFIPSCSVMPLRKRAVAAVVVQPSCATTLETLTEGREDDDDAGEDWSF